MHVRRGAPARTVLLFGSTPQVQLEVCRSLGRAGYLASILRLQPRRTAADASRYRKQSLYIGLPETSASAYAHRLAEFLRGSMFDHVLPLDATAMELVALHRHASPEELHVIGPAMASNREATNRWNALAIAKAAGLQTLDTLLLKRGVDDLPPTPELPCWVRPVHETAIVDDAPATLSSPTVRLGRSGSRSRLVRPDPWTFEVAERVVKRLQWSSFMVIECCRRDSDGALTFLDLQFGAGCSLLTLRRSGVDLPRSLLQAIDRTAASGESSRRVDAIDDPAPTLQALSSSAGKLLQKVALRLRSTFLWRSGAASIVPPLIPSQAVLVVCKGNMNRSMVAEAVLRNCGFSQVTSAGLLGVTGRRPSEAAERFIKDRLGVSAAGLRSQSVHRALARLGHVDVVICFERRHVVELAQRHPWLLGQAIERRSAQADRSVLTRNISMQGN